MSDSDTAGDARLDAAREQRKTYAGAPCPKCGSAERYTSSGSCATCSRSRANARTDQIRALLRGESIE